MVDIILMDANDEMSLLFDLNSVNLFRLIELVSAWVFRRNVLPSKSNLVPRPNSAHINIVKDL